MSNQTKPQYALANMQVSLNVKLATLWTSFMFLVIYVDYFHLYMPDMIKDIEAERVYEFDITQGFLLLTLASVTIPALMIFLSAALPPKANRMTNILVATVYIPYMLFNLSGVVWIHMVFGAVVEVVLLYLIIRFAWKWPRIET